jgi:homocysteine S-methyltransferase
VDFLEQLETQIVCGDGAIGTLLLADGVPLERCFEELCVSEPDRIRKIHEQYIGAGARVIKTNTFGANAVRLERFRMESRVSEINQRAAQIARKAAGGKDVFVAGSVGPLGVSSEEATARGVDRAQCFREQIRALSDGGVQLIVFETFMDFNEMEIALRANKQLSDLPEICSFACASSGILASGMPLADAFAKLRELGAKIAGANCMNDPREMVQLLQNVPKKSLLAAYPTAGAPEFRDGRCVYPTSPDSFAQATREMVEEGARLIGGCCGTTPAHIAAMGAAMAHLQSPRSFA